MGREVRFVPKGWEHPRDESGGYVPLHTGPFSIRLREWEEGEVKWVQGFRRGHDDEKWVSRLDGHHDYTFEEWSGERPKAEDYMPEWPEHEATQYVMYETCTEGTPISPSFDTAEDLARWLADTGASAFGSMTASYEGWLATINRPHGAIGMLMTIDENGVATSMQSGVDAMKRA